MYRFLFVLALLLAVHGNVLGQPLNRPTSPAPLPEPIVQLGHTGHVRDIAFTPDNKFILTSDASTAYLWNIETGMKVCEFPMLASEETGSVILSPNGKYVFV